MELLPLLYVRTGSGTTVVRVWNKMWRGFPVYVNDKGRYHSRKQLARDSPLEIASCKIRVIETKDMPRAETAPAPLIESRIWLIRGYKVLLDSDLAVLYQVETGALNRAVRRNRDRFPEDFMFQVSVEEAKELLRCQIGTSNEGRGGRRYRPYVFTEQGVAMLSGVLTSARAVEVNIAIMRTFVRLRQLLTTHEDLARQLDELRWKQEEQGHQIQAVFETIQHLIEAPADEPKRRIGFPTSRAGHEPQEIQKEKQEEEGEE